MSQRLIILVSGAPAAGKTTLATALAAALNLPLICKDDIKEAMVDALDGPAADLTWSRRVGGAAMQVLWRLAERCPAAVLEANFRPHNAYEHARLKQLDAHIIELHCACPADELIRRFATRARTAHPAHPLTGLSPDLRRIRPAHGNRRSHRSQHGRTSRPPEPGCPALGPHRSSTVQVDTPQLPRPARSSREAFREFRYLTPPEHPDRQKVKDAGQSLHDFLRGPWSQTGPKAQDQQPDA